MSKKKKSGKPKPGGTGPPGGTGSPGGQASSKETQTTPVVISGVEIHNLPIASSESNLTPARSSISRYISFGLLLGVIAIVGILFYEVMASFLIPLFLAALLVVVFRPLHRRILEKCGGRQKLSALLTTASVLLTVLVPIGILLFMAAAEGRQVYSQFNATKIVEGVRQIRTNMKLNMPSQRELRLIENELMELQQSVALTESEKDRHAVRLYEIQEAGKVLANNNGLTWPNNTPTEDEPPPETVDSESDWMLFATNLLEARDLHDKIQWNSDKDPLKSQQRNETAHEYQVKLNATADHFAEFRAQFLGGKTKAWLIELVNPSDNDSASYATTFVNFLRDRLFRLTGAGVVYAGNLLLGTAIMIIGLYFFLLDGPKMIETFKGLSPIDDDHEQELVTEFGRVSRAVVVATLVSASAQGFLAGIGFYFAGLESIFLLTVLSAVLAMVPFVGAAAVWIPCCFYLYFFDNNLAAAIGLGVYGTAIISMADNLIKPYILHGQSNIHPLFALLSVLGGVSTLGPIGILIGPMVVAFLQTLLKILQSEMTDFDQLSNESQ